jgi:uncharacterized protein (TIGR00255 family)
MTGYGYAEQSDDSSIVAAEVKAYNNRYFDVIVNLPSSLGPLEPRVREYVSHRVSRGRVEVSLKARGVAEQTTVVVDKENLRGYLSALGELRSEAGIEEPVGLSDLLRLEGVLRMEKTADVDTLWSALEPVFGAAFAQFEAARVAEGRSTHDDIRSQLERIDAAVAVVRTFAPTLEDRIKGQVRERFEEVLGDDVDESRVYAETAVLLVKYSVNEELVRLSTHLESFRELLESTEPIGKRLDFICQELNREINTVGSKSIVTEVNQAVIDAKDALENIREQLRNVE